MLIKLKAKTLFPHLAFPNMPYVYIRVFISIQLINSLLVGIVEKVLVYLVDKMSV